MSEWNLSLSDDKMRDTALAMGSAQSLISREYLTQMKNAELIPLSEAEKVRLPQIRLLRITNLVYDRQESVMEKLNSLFSALSVIRNLNLILILRNHVSYESETLELYMGLSGNCVEDTLKEFSILEQSIRGNFPGCEVQTCDDELIQTIMPDVAYCKEASGCAISSVSADAVQRSDDEAFVQGMEKFADGMRGNPYSLILLASPVSSDEIARSVQAYRELYTKLSPYRSAVGTWNETETEGTTETIGTQISETLSRAKIHNTGWSVSESTGTGNSVSQSNFDMTGALIETGFTLLGSAGGFFSKVPGLSFAGNALGKQFRDAVGAAPKTENTSTQKSETHTHQESDGEQTQEAQQAAQNQSFASNQGRNVGVSFQTTKENKRVVDLLRSIERQIDRMTASFGQGAYNMAAYVVASDQILSETGASLYRSLLCGSQPDTIAAINTWDDGIRVKTLQDYLLHAKHPRLRLTHEGALNDLDLTTFVPCAEAPLHFFWPRKSLPGLSVSHHAEFARSMPCVIAQADNPLSIGRVYHLGREEKNAVFLPTDVLSSHMCIAGAPGSGKSNFSYQLLRQLMDRDVHFLVIEPAKGEYANVLGGLKKDGKPSVYCFSTRESHGNPFSINPFAFPDGITALEHMDALLSVLNTCWPMYAAMADILKDAVIRVYDETGWDMDESGLAVDEDWRYPTFQDLMEILPALIEHSDYSAEVKGNYKGSLLTRVKSMTNGINRRIFGSDCLNDEALFNRNMLIDISNIASSENLSLMMGVLVIRLSEFRRSERKGMNRALHHVTLLEEAHHLLSAHQMTLPGEGSAVGGKAVELLNRAIAEMRSYGEGFVIVDQSPSRLDSSVISNTATKVAFNLQGSADSAMMGQAMALSAEQAEEIPTLPQGVCIVRSRGWMAPVQAKVPLLPASEYRALPAQTPPKSGDNLRQSRGDALSAFLHNDLEKAEAAAKNLNSDDEKSRLLLDALQTLLEKQKLSGKDRTALYQGLFETNRWFYPPSTELMQKWDGWVRKRLLRCVALDSRDLNRIIAHLLITQSKNKKSTQELLQVWTAMVGSD